jgi:hypothetical protein
MSRGAGLARHTNFALAFGLRGIPPLSCAFMVPEFGIWNLELLQ